MAEIGASINLQVKGTSRLDRLINSASQLDSIVKNLNKNPIELNTKTAASNLDKFDAELKALQISIGKSEKGIDSAGNAINEYATQIASLQTKLNQLNPNTVAYNKVLDRQQKAIRGLAQAQGDLSKSQKDLESSQGKLFGAEKNASSARTAKLAAEALNGLADSYIKVKASQKGAEPGVTKRPLLESSISQINSQADALKLVAANAKIASSEFNRFSIASQAASQELFAARQKQLSAVAFGLSGSAPSVNLGRGGANTALTTRNQVQDLVNLYPQIVKSEAGLSAYGDELRRIQSLVPYASEEFRKLENVLAELNQEISQVGLRGQKSAITLPQPIKALGPTSSVEGTLKQRQQYAEAVNKQYQKQLDLNDKIERSALGVSDKEALSLQLNQALDALGENRLEDAQKMTIEINRQVSAMSRLQKTGRGGTQVFGALGTGFLPVSGRMPSGEVIPGSPANTGRQAKAKLSWQSALAQMSVVASELEDTAKARGAKIQMDWNLAFEKAKDIISDATLAGLQEGTKAAVSLGQQQIKEMQRSTAKLWREFGGPARPPKAAGAGGTYRTGEFSPMGGARRLTNTLASGAIIEQSLLNLQGKGVNVADRLVQLQNALSAAKQDTFEINIKNLDALSDELELAGRYAQLQRKIIAGQGGGGRGPKAGKESGFRPALTSKEINRELDAIVRDFNAVAPKAGGAGENVASTFAAEIKQGASSAAASAKAFASAAAQAINDVFGIASPSRFMIELVKNLTNTYISEMQKAYPRIQAATNRAFGEETLLRNVKTLKATNKGFEFADRPSRGFRTRRDMTGTPGATSEFNNMMLQFRKDIAELTTQPEIYGSLLKGLPDFGITTDIAGAASRRAFAAEIPSFMSAQRQIGPGELEKTISEAFAKYVRSIRTPDPWVGLVGDYRQFIDKVVAATQELKSQQLTLPSSRVVGALPPATGSISSIQRQRVQQAYARSEARGLSVMSEDAFGGGGGLSLSAGNFGFMADSARIGRLSGIGRALPPAIDVTAADLESESRSLRQSISNLFDRITSTVRSALEGGIGFGGGGGGRRGGGGSGAAGAGGGVPQSIGDLQRALGLGDLAPIARATGEQIDELTARLSELSKRIDPTTQDFAELTKQLGVLGREQERRAPGAGFLTRRFGPRGGRAVSEGLVGGAFPLLFGQGLGAAVGGGAGGALGGFAGGNLGFGLSLAGTALGTAFDTAVQGATELGTALNDTTQTFDKVKERALFSSKETEKLADAMQEMGFVASSSIVAQQEVIKKVGVGGVQSLKELGDSSDRLNRAWAEFNLQLQAALAGPMAGLLDWVSGIVEESNKRGRREAGTRDVFSSLSPQDQKSFNKEVSKRMSNVANLPGGAAVEQIAQIRSQVAAEFANKANVEVGVKVKEIDIDKEEIAKLTKQLEIIDLGKSLVNQVRSVAREQQDLDKQRADLVRSYEESIGQIRERVENEVASRRFSVLEQENRLLDQQSQDRLKQLRLVNQEIIAGAGQGQRPEVEEAAKRAAEIVAQFTEDQLSAEEEAAKIKRDAALDALKFDYQAAEFKASIEKDVSRLNVETARRVADINEQVRRRNEEFDNRRFAIEKQIADLQLKMIQNELALATKNAELPIDARQAAYDLYQLVGQQRKEVGDIAAPPALRGVGQVGGGGVSTQNIDAVVLQQKQAITAAVNAALEAQDLLPQEGIGKFSNSIETLIKGVEAPINAINQSILDADKERTRSSELISQGLTETVAQRVIEIEKAKELAIAQFDTIINELEKRKAVEATTEALRAQIDTEIQGIKDRKKAFEEAAGTAPRDGKPGTGVIGKAIESEQKREPQEIPGAKIQEFISTAEQELDDLQAVAVRVSQSIGDAVGNSLASGITGLVEGTTTAKEVFAGFLKEVGQILIKEGTKMIATYIAIGIAKVFAGLASGGGGGGGGSGGGISDIGNWQQYAFEGPGVPFTPPAFAEGGFVTGPTNALIGEGGQPEYVIPASKMSAAMSRYSRGARGESVIPGNGSEGGEGGGTAVATAPIDVRYTVERINSVDYVTADQFQSGMQQAATQGAQRGEQATIRRLKQSQSTRSRLGIR